MSGTYVLMAVSPAYLVDHNRIRLYNDTQSSMVVIGGNVVADDALDRSAVSAVLHTVFTANGTDAYRIDHYTESTQGTNGLGVAVGDGAAEVYTQVLLIKIG